jgi:hypothetical protein
MVDVSFEGVCTGDDGNMGFARMSGGENDMARVDYPFSSISSL